MYVLASGRAWRDLPPSFGVPFQTAHRRFAQCTKAGAWPRIHRAVLDQLGSQGMIDWARDRGRRLRPGEKRGALTGPGPVDRGKPGKLHADKAYDHADLRAWVRDRGIAVRIARKGAEASDELGRHRWVIERTIAWLSGYRRLTLRYERNASHFLAFLTLAAAITSYKKLAKATT